MVSNGGPKIHQKSSKMHPGTLRGLPECICAPLDHQNGLQRPPNGPKMVPGDPKKTEKLTKSNNQMYNKHIYIFDFYQLISILQICFSIAANPCNLQISSQLVAKGAGGRGRSP